MAHKIIQRNKDDAEIYAMGLVLRLQSISIFAFQFESENFAKIHFKFLSNSIKKMCKLLSFGSVVLPKKNCCNHFTLKMQICIIAH